eukprot:1935011-Alexandrium_andersonii.AAC.1
MCIRDSQRSECRDRLRGSPTACSSARGTCIARALPTDRAASQGPSLAHPARGPCGSHGARPPRRK